MRKVLSDDLIAGCLELIYRVDQNILTEASAAEVLGKIERGLVVLQRKVENEAMSDADLATAKRQIRDLIKSLIGRRIQEPTVQHICHSFINDRLAYGLLEHPKYRFTQDWFSDHIRQWGMDFGCLRDRPNLRFLEIGCFEGRCTCWLLENILTHETSTITCVDPFVDNPMQEVYFDSNIERTGCSHKVTKLRGYSQQALRFLSPESYDFIYIDGSHVEGDVLQDAMFSWQLANRDGIIVFDDYELQTAAPPWLGIFQCPKRAIDAFLAAFECQYEVIHKGWQLVIRKTGAIQDLPPDISQGTAKGWLPTT